MYVDLDVVYRDSRASFSPLPNPESTPTPITTIRKTATLPAIPAETVNGPSTQAYGQAEEVVRQNRLRALRDLEKQLGKLYLAEVQRDEQESLAALSPLQKSSDAKFLAEYHTAFEEYAERRAPLIAHLALLAGWPDRGPKSAEGVEGPAAMRIQAMNALRTKISTLDRRFDLETDKLAALYTSETDKALTEIRAKAEIAKSNALDRARKDAADQLQTTRGDDGGTLAEFEALSLPEVPEKSISIDASAQKIIPPVIDRDTSTALTRAERDSIIEELKIWLAINGYQRANSSANGPDRTAEFLKWRHTHHPGP